MKSLIPNNILNSIAGYVCLMDTNGNFLQANDEQVNVMGYQSSLEIIGKTYHQFKGLSTKVIEDFISTYQSALNSEHAIRYLSYHKYADGNWHLLLGDKNRVLNEAGEVAGLLSQAKDVTHDRLIDITQFLFEEDKKYTPASGFDYYFTSEKSERMLSQKELVVLFFFLRGKTARDIAKTIHRSEKTVNFHLSGLKSKFDVTSKPALIEKAIYNGYMNTIPELLLKDFIL